jgi:hypothetical protein
MWIKSLSFFKDFSNGCLTKSRKSYASVSRRPIFKRVKKLRHLAPLLFHTPLSSFQFLWMISKNSSRQFFPWYELCIILNDVHFTRFWIVLSPIFCYHEPYNPFKTKFTQFRCFGDPNPKPLNSARHNESLKFHGSKRLCSREQFYL